MSEPRVCPRDCLTEIVPYQPGKPAEEVKRELGLQDVIKLASNENPLGASPKAGEAVRRALKQVAVYPDGACYYLRQALAKKLAVAPGQVLLGNGSSELIVHLGLAYVCPGDEILTSELTFVMYSSMAKLMGARFIETPMRAYTYDLEAMLAQVTAKTKLIFIANPNNPTGTAVAPKALERFVHAVPTTCLVVLDEAYYEYADPARRTDTLAWLRSGRPNLVVLRTFSKCHGLAGLRIGYGVASADVISNLDKVRDPFNVNSLAQAAALAALRDPAHVRRSVALARRERSWLAAQLRKVGFEAVPSQANFVFARVPSHDGAHWFKALLRQGVIIRPVAGPYIRITAGTRKQNEKLVRALKKVLGPV